MSYKIINSFAFAFVLIILTCGTASAFSDSGDGAWKYQQDIVVHENSGESLTDYQVMIKLEGDDFPVEVQSDGADIRFTDENDVELNYWIEEFNKGSRIAKVWVKIPEIPARGQTKIKMWYGNPNAGSMSDGDAVFEFFDDFEGTSLDINKWNSPHTVNAGTSVLINSGLLYFDVKSGYGHTGGSIISKRTLPSGDYACETKIKFTNYYRSAFGAYSGFTNTISYDDSYYGKPTKVVSTNLHDYTDIGNYLTLVVDDIGRVSGTTSIIIRNKWFKLKTIYAPPTYAKGIWEQLEVPFDEITLENSGSGGITPNYVVIGIGDYETNEHTYFDFVFVHKYISSEPTTSLEAPKSSGLSVKKSAFPHSIRLNQETTITLSLENSGTTDITDIEVKDSIHPSFDRVSGDLPDTKRFDLIGFGESREIEYKIRAKESGTFNLYPATVTYADGDGNIQEGKSDVTSIKVIQDDGGGISSSSSSASVNLHGEKTDVELGEDVLLKLSAVNIIGNPAMHVQVIIIPPSGWSVTSSEFAKSGAGQYTTTYELESGGGKDIEVRIVPNQIGDEFQVEGRIIYYFGDDVSTREDHTLSLPIKVRAQSDDVPIEVEPEEDSEESPGFGLIFAVGAVVIVWYIRIRK